MSGVLSVGMSPVHVFSVVAFAATGTFATVVKDDTSVEYSVAGMVGMDERFGRGAGIDGIVKLAGRFILDANSGAPENQIPV